VQKKRDIGSVFRYESIASGVINTIGAFLTFFYLNVIDPVPIAGESFRSLDSFASFAFVLIFAVFFIVGISGGNKLKKRFKHWALRMERGEITLADVPEKIKRDVLNFPLYAAGIAGTMWLSASIIAAYITQSSRVFMGVFVWGGGVAVALLYFVDDLLWKPVIQVFFPEGNLSKVRAFRLPVFWKLLIGFVFTGILPPALLVYLTRQRTNVLLSAPNPDVLLANLHILQLFILIASVIASIGLAFFITRGITNPLTSLRTAMEYLQEGDLDAKVPITTNDELGFLGERFNQMATELRQKEKLRSTNALLNEQLIEIKALEAVLREQAIRDPLTELFNRRYMEDALENEIRRASRSQKTFSIVLIDLDFLKEINDRYGHVAGGDAALRLLSRNISALCRAEDTFCRYAGDEFLVVLYDTPSNSACERALEWQAALKTERITIKDEAFGITFSAGVAEFPSHAEDVEKLIQKADKALYRAKEAGRNRVVICEE